MLSFKKHTKRTGGPIFYGKDPFTKQGCHHSMRDLLELIRSGHDFILENCNPHAEIMAMIGLKEKGMRENQELDRTIKGNTDMLNRAIRFGGIAEYAEYLENLLLQKNKGIL